MTDTIDTEEQAQEVTAPKPGALMREQREAAGLPYATVAEALHLTIHYVKALENDEYEKLPGLTFVKGYFKSYARYLGMDTDAVLACYEAYLKELGDLHTEQENTTRIRKRNDQVVLWAIIAGAILVIGLIAGWWFFGRGDDSPGTVSAVPAAARTPPPPQAAIAQAPPAAETRQALREEDIDDEVSRTEAADIAAGAGGIDGRDAAALDGEAANADGPVAPLNGEQAIQPATPGALDEAVAIQDSSAAAQENGDDATAAGDDYTVTRDAAGARHVSLLGDGDDRLRLDFTGSSWVEVDDSDKARLYNDLHDKGDELNIQGLAPFYVLLGDATQVQVTLNAMPVNFNARIRNDNTARFIVGLDANDAAYAGVAH